METKGTPAMWGVGDDERQPAVKRRGDVGVVRGERVDEAAVDERAGDGGVSVTPSISGAGRSESETPGSSASSARPRSVATAAGSVNA